MFRLCVRFGSTLVLAALIVSLGGCGFFRVFQRAPVEDRGPATTQTAPVAGAVAPSTLPPVLAPLPAPGAENAGRAGYYTVKHGDTLIRIGLEHGQSARDIARWNNLENPNRIEVGQVLRVSPPGTSPGTAASVAVSKPVSTASAVPLASAAPSSPEKHAATPLPGAAGPDEIAWIWPTSGPVLAGFDEVKNKGLDIGGKAGDPVLAAADGRVVYVGAGLRGYGNLIILKHNNTYLTAYAHNQTLLIKEDQAVRKGQKIAEMGSSDADRVKLHFEVRKQGKPVDPASYLPVR